MKSKLKFTTPKQTVLAFLKMWLKEAESDAPSTVVKNHGLCLNFMRTAEGLTISQRHAAHDWLDDALWEVHSETLYPFGGLEKYHEDLVNNVAHLNEERLAWVRKMLADNS